MRKILGILGLFLIAANSYGAFSISLDAGQLRSNSTTPLPTGSLLIFVAAGNDGIFETPTQLSQGNYVAGDDVLLSVMTDPNSAQPFNTFNGTNETQNLAVITQAAGAAAPGQQIALMWFPSITYAQWQTGSTPTAGTTFGFYNPTFWGNASNNPDGGNSWIVPAPGSIINLNFITTDADLAGSQPPLRGFGNNFIVAIPEPSSFALIGVGAALLPLLRRRKA